MQSFELKVTMLLIVATVAILFCVSPVYGCTMANWGRSFDKAGYSSCDNFAQYINGLMRSNYGGRSDGIGLLEEARCCPRPQPYYNQPTQCIAADWTNSLGRDNTWSKCRKGFFLQGLYRSGTSFRNKLGSIEYGRCCKPAIHPYLYGHCYTQDVATSFNDFGTSKCRDGYFMTGLYRGGCDKLKCIDKFRCCKMYPNPPPLTSLSDVKTRVMDVTVRNLGLLAHYLGYGWCAGCRAQYVGEDFRRNGDSWEADKKGPCNGYKADHRLKMHYGDFKFSIKDIKYGKQVIQTLQPETYDQGQVVNADPTGTLKHTVEREVRRVRTVTHTITSSWKVGAELGIEIFYNPPTVTGGIGGKASFKFNLEQSDTNSQSTATQQYKNFKISSEKIINPNTTASYKIMLSKSRTTVAYTATIIAHFSAELDGFLRWGGGYNGDSTNYHHKHTGMGSRPTFKYRFGSSSKPFYQALKEESDRDVRPWEWSNMKSRYADAQGVINALTSEGMYEFTLTGQFEDVVGQRAYIHWKTTSFRRKRSLLDRLASANNKPISSTNGNPPRLFPSPPKVTIEIGKINENEPKEKNVF